MAESITQLLDAGWRVVVVHGNGPQVGNLAIQQEMGRDEVPEMPLFSLGAMTEGQLGSLIAIALYRACGGRYHIAAMLSHVIVDLGDPAFSRPTRPRGWRENGGGRSPRTRGGATVASSHHRSPRASSRSMRFGACSMPAT